MPISQFTIGVSRTMNLGNFESLRVEAAITVDVPDYANEMTGLTLGGEPVHFDKDQAPLGIAETLKAQAQAQLRQLLEETYRNYERKKST